MKKVVLLGDSIRLIGYGKKVPELLEGEYTVYQPEVNCRFVKNTLRMLHDLREEIAGADVIHWNNGLWDCHDLFGDGEMFTSEDEYAVNIIRVAKRLLTVTPKVIFATTTPVRQELHYDRNAMIARYNARVVPELEMIGVRINDLYTPVMEHIEEYIRETDRVHLTDAGINACAAQVAAAIREIDQ